MISFPLIDTHTGGEPTRVIFADQMPWSSAALPERREGSSPMQTRQWLDRQADWVRRATVREPRGSECMVGAWVDSPSHPDHTASVVFFNNVGYLGMCGHGLIGVVAAMNHRERLDRRDHHFETPAGVVTATLHDDESVTFANVRSYRYASDVQVELSADFQTRLLQHSAAHPAVLTGDIAYGGNWFFLVTMTEIPSSNEAELTSLCIEIRDAIRRAGITGANGEQIDHIELSAPATSPLPDDVAGGGRNFVLCPGGHFDRSPCGTGTSAKLACLAADGLLQPGKRWLQESIIGSRFDATYAADDGGVVVSVTGRAHIMGETKCILDPSDPYAHGIDFAGSTHAGQQTSVDAVEAVR
ncbi:MAG: proline racemase family protein [Planctomycetota bacterium]